MHVIHARNVNDALPQGIKLLKRAGVERDSRNGPVRVVPCPVTTVYERPTERVLMYPQRDANPFFHLYESLWMLAGRNDVAGVAFFARQMKAYSDDGVTQHGAYGKRWRDWFTTPPDGATTLDQLTWAIKRLRADPKDRRIVISMWDGHIDPTVADNGGKDVPCNTQAYLWVDPAGALCLTVCNRSNDVVWGAYGANAVHFSVMQEYVATALGLPVGRMWQVSNNFHGYLNTLEPLLDLKLVQPYGELSTATMPMFDAGAEQQFDEDVKMLLNEGVTLGLRSTWLRRVAVPMLVAHAAYKNKNDPERWVKASEAIAQVRAPDWQLAGSQWLERRKWQADRAADDGVNHDNA